MIYPAGSNSGDAQCEDISIIHDAEVEGDHSFNLASLTATTPGVIGYQSVATVIIADNGIAILALMSLCFKPATYIITMNIKGYVS